MNTLDISYRRGAVRALAISAIVVAVMVGLLLHSLRETRRADTNAARVTRLMALHRLERGVRLLEGGDRAGLRDLQEARRIARSLPELREAARALWDAWNRAYAAQPKTGGHTGRPVSAIFGPDGALLATVSEGRTVRLWDVATGRLATVPTQHHRVTRSLALSPDRKLLALIAQKRVWVWDLTTGEQRGRPLEHPLRVYSAAFSADGRRLTTGCVDGSVRYWDTQTGQPRLIFAADGSFGRGMPRRSGGLSE